MASFFYSLKAKSFALLLVILLLMVTACSGGGSSGQNTPSNSSITITVGGQSDIEAQLLTKLYVLLLRHAGFKVVERDALGTDDIVFNAINSGQIDLSPEFTATGLTKLGLNSIGNALQDYLQIKQGYEAKYHITWLSMSPLNDTYGICTTQAEARRLGATKISDLAGKAASLTIATSSAGVKYGVNVVQSIYGFTFEKVTTYNQEALTFPAVASGAQNLNICQTTDPAISKYNFVLLQDNKDAFPTNDPAPMVRDALLHKAPQIATVLNKLAPFLTTQVSQQLQVQIAAGETVTAVATQFLQRKGLL
jgi:osmoprotectant transport system substrate-binding protein